MAGRFIHNANKICNNINIVGDIQTKQLNFGNAGQMSNQPSEVCFRVLKWRHVPWLKTRSKIHRIWRQNCSSYVIQRHYYVIIYDIIIQRHYIIMLLCYSTATWFNLSAFSDGLLASVRGGELGVMREREHPWASIQVHLLTPKITLSKWKANSMKHCLKETSNKFMVVLTFI